MIFTKKDIKRIQNATSKKHFHLDKYQMLKALDEGQQEAMNLL